MAGARAPLGATDAAVRREAITRGETGEEPPYVESPSIAGDIPALVPQDFRAVLTAKPAPHDSPLTEHGLFSHRRPCRGADHLAGRSGAAFAAKRGLRQAGRLKVSLRGVVFRNDRRTER